MDNESKLIEQYTPLVFKVAREYRTETMHLDDLTQEGFIGLLAAIRDYDPERSPFFTSYAERRIRSAISGYANSNVVGAFYTPVHHVRANRFLYRAIKALEKDAAEVIPEEIMAVWIHPDEEKLWSATQKKLRILKQLIKNTLPAKTYETIVEDVSQMATALPIEEALNISAEPVDFASRQRLERALAMLPVEHLDILEMYEDGHTYEEIAREVNLTSRGQVKYVHSTIIKKLKKILDSE